MTRSVEVTFCFEPWFRLICSQAAATIDSELAKPAPDLHLVRTLRNAIGELAWFGFRPRLGA